MAVKSSDLSEFNVFGKEVATTPRPLDHVILFDYWMSICPTNCLPGRQHFDPQAVSKILKNLWLLDVVGPPLDFKFRLVGTNLVKVTGYDLTGQLFDMGNPSRARSAARLIRVVNDRIAARGREHVQFFPDKDYIQLDVLHLPLARDGQTVDMVVSVTVFSFADGLTL